MSSPNQSKAAWYDYTIGGATATGNKLKEILHISDKSFVFLDDEDVLSWEYDDSVCIDHDLTISQASTLISQTNNSIKSKKAKNFIYRQIGTAISNALDSREKDDKIDFFKEIRSLINHKMQESLQITYFITGLLSALALGLLSWILYYFSNIQVYVLSFLLGTFGALVSVIHRFKDIKIYKFTSHLFIGISGFVRILLGSFFGIVFYLFVKAGLLMQIAASNEYALIGLSFVAGFSERMVPELIASIEKRTNNYKKES